MLSSQINLYEPNRKRQVLVVDDEEINREILGNVLSQNYEVLYACDGTQALEMLREKRDVISLVLLDLLMPGVHGLEVLRQMTADLTLRQIPVIVMTADHQAEVESLKQGAVDFIPKPYDQPEVILARAQRTIELSEDRQTIESTERDSLTGLYNREYFYRYARQFDQHNRDVEMDAIVLDINHFRLINERYGKKYGDEILRRVARSLSEMVRSAGGIIGRRQGDTFLVYCPHGVDHQALMDGAMAALSQDAHSRNSRIRLRMGVYPKADMSIDIERRLDRAKAAADHIRNNYLQSISYYSSESYQSEIFAEQLLEDFQEALAQGQFQAFYQPKFDIRTQTPTLSSAEALVRWFHPKLGMVSPGDFIPLFESNGLISELDHYIWRQAAAQIRDWKDRFGVTIPVSVNVSRVDMYDPNLAEHIQVLAEEFGLEPSELHLEVTESAYTQDYTQIIEVVNRLRSLGFHIEMDDFGTGYSSLNMISSLPIDALKLDMKFVQSVFSERRDYRMLELIIDIAEYLSVPVIAEGVETDEQLSVLRAMGCHMVQGFYFSKPVSAQEFERFVLEKKNAMEHTPTKTEQPEPTNLSYRKIAQALSQDYFSIYYVDLVTSEFIEYSLTGAYENLQLDKIGKDFFETTRRSIQRVVYPPDQEKAMRVWRKELVLDELERTGTFSTMYRLVIHGKPIYVSIKAVRLNDGDGDHIIVGINNIDAQMKREDSIAQSRETALKDTLTGVKNSRAYAQMEERLNVEIDQKQSGPFAVAVCDVNDLKLINETQGHMAGDQQIRDACSIVCCAFSHSPVFRISGDSFVAILRRGDYERRAELVKRLGQRCKENLRVKKGTVAFGMAEFCLDRDKTLAEVFERANANMIRNKRAFKNRK